MSSTSTNLSLIWIFIVQVARKSRPELTPEITESAALAQTRISQKQNKTKNCRLKSIKTTVQKLKGAYTEFRTESPVDKIKGSLRSSM